MLINDFKVTYNIVDPRYNASPRGEDNNYMTGKPLHKEAKQKRIRIC